MMKFLDLLFGTASKKPSVSANIAKERLQVIVAHHKNIHEGHDDVMMAHIKQDILNVLSKYYPSADFGNINVQLDKEGNQSMLQIDLTIPENSEECV
jgi:cell division topological specificity factor